ncbi:unnamed protein product [Trifolium pratense]|uniref:Uncharacterized protein n=1 Tax=Trifolium pratense TaxID=57577 RepID=A0ACB0IW13_TRIPR|nr:unnamed protein product [Trifolium pratense]
MSIPFFSFVLLDSLSPGSIASGRKLFIFVSPRLSICHRRLLLEFVCLVSNLFWLYTRFLLPPLSFYLALSLFIIVSVLICFFFVFSPWPIGLISCAMPFREELLGDSSLGFKHTFTWIGRFPVSCVACDPSNII